MLTPTKFPAKLHRLDLDSAFARACDSRPSALECLDYRQLRKKMTAVGVRASSTTDCFAFQQAPQARALVARHSLRSAEHMSAS